LATLAVSKLTFPNSVKSLFPQDQCCCPVVSLSSRAVLSWLTCVDTTLKVAHRQALAAALATEEQCCVIGFMPCGLDFYDFYDYSEFGFEENE